MGRSKENNPEGGLVRSTSMQEGSRLGFGGHKVVKEPTHNLRRALSSINQNVIGTSLNPCVVNKKELNGKNVISDKDQALLPRPVTRSFAAQMVQHCPEEIEATMLVEEPSGMEEEIEDESDSQVPMFVKHTETMMDEIDRMDEVEMEDAEVAEDSELDIDSSNLSNPLEVVEYIDDLYAFYRKTEISSCVSPTYMDHQFDINEKMRAILIDWLIEVHYKFELMDETLFLTVNLIDRFLERQTVARKKLQLVGVTAMLIACKYEEVCVPIVEDFVQISDKAYTKQEVLDMERLMINTLQFNLSVPTPYVFMRRFLKAAQSDKKLVLLSFFIIELCLVEYEMLKYPPSLLAAAAIYTAQCSSNRFKQWTRTSQWHSNYTEDDLLECSKMMVTFHQRAATGKLTGVYRKYSAWKLGCVAKYQPAQFLLTL